MLFVIFFNRVYDYCFYYSVGPVLHREKGNLPASNKNGTGCIVAHVHRMSPNSMMQFQNTIMMNMKVNDITILCYTLV